MDEQQATKLASHWIESWNSHDLDRIMEHYSDDVTLTSPVAARLLSDPAGTVRGKTALRAYFAKGLAAYPNLKFELHDTLFGLHSVVLYYRNQNGARTGELMELGADGKVVRVIANYAGL
jgi:hypothetical protein